MKCSGIGGCFAAGVEKSNGEKMVQVPPFSGVSTHRLEYAGVLVVEKSKSASSENVKM